MLRCHRARSAGRSPGFGVSLTIAESRGWRGPHVASVCRAAPRSPGEAAGAPEYASHSRCVPSAARPPGSGSIATR